jgi:hypothetical protein
MEVATLAGDGMFDEVLRHNTMSAGGNAGWRHVATA